MSCKNKIRSVSKKDLRLSEVLELALKLKEAGVMYSISIITKKGKTTATIQYKEPTD